MMLQLDFLESSIAWRNLLIYQILFTSFTLKKKKKRKKERKKKERKKRKNELHSWYIWQSGYVFYSLLLKVWSGLVGSVVKNPPAMQETWVWTLGQEDPWRRKWQPTPVFLSGKSHGWRSLMGYSPWGCKESDMPEQLTLNDLDSLSVVKPHTPCQV